MTKPVKTPRSILDNFGKYAFDEGMKCVRENIDQETGLWKLAKKFVDMTEQENSALAQLEECYKPLEPIDGVLSVEEIEKQIDLEYYLSDYNDDDYKNDYREYEARRERLAHAIYNLITKRGGG